jgi:hypothetical protein
MGATRRYPNALLQDASQAPSWAPDLDILGHRSPHYPPFQSPVMLDHRSLLRLGGLAPIARFSDDLRVLYTKGFFMGRVIKKGSFDGRFATDHHSHGYRALRESLLHSAMLVGLFGLNVPFLLQQVSESPTYRILAYAELDDPNRCNQLCRHIDGVITSSRTSLVELFDGSPLITCFRADHFI